MNETDIKRLIRTHLGAEHQNVRIFSNPVGTGWMGHETRLADGSLLLRRPTKVSFGLYKGSPDEVGWTTVTVTPDMVGKKVAIFTGIEVKRPGGPGARPDQQQFIQAIQRAGGLSGVARSPEEAALIVSGWPGLGYGTAPT